MENHHPVINPLSDCVSVIQRGELKVIQIAHPKATAEIALHGAHLLSFKPQGQQDVIWLSEKAEFNKEKAIRGGIPVCWPWFGRIAAPAHGFARTSEWYLVEHRESEQGVIVCLALEESEQSRAIWPFAFQARLYIEVSDSLKVTLDICNTDNKPWRFSGALHSYLNIADIAQSETTGMGPEYIDSLQDGKTCQGGSILQLTDTVDRVYTQPEEVIEVSDLQNKRIISVKNSGANSAVIWNPWLEGASAMADMQDSGYQTMLCVESAYHASSLETGKELQPDESYQLVTEIAVKPL